MIDLTGKVVSLVRDYRSRKPILTLELNEEPESLIDYGDAELCIKISKKKEHRSLDSNAYFHVLCDKLRRRNRVSMARMKNILISRYGQVDYLPDGTQVVIKTNIPVEQMLEQETLHTQACGVDVQDGKEIIYYRVYRGSHTYNTQEMHELIEGTIIECKELGIETATPDEIARMEALWARRHGRR